jgi:DNA-binding GntR family transcriptional regulator
MRRQHRQSATAARPEKYRDLSERAYQHIREQILRGHLSFGSEISRKEVAKQLGISVLPVSVALQRLENESLVESTPRVGTRVRVPTPQDIRGFYVAREALESQAARLFAERAGAPDKQEIYALAKELDRLEHEVSTIEEPSEDQLYAVRRKHMLFHMRIAELAGCPFLCELLSRNQILVFNWFYDRLFGRRALPQRWHEDLAEALAQGDVEVADRAMRAHVRFRMEEVLQRLEPFLSLNHAELSAALAAARR